ncbi:SCO family protein [candidate division KSB1 bacterium]|nr:SCO family protein [candidate division KSB1 bacterium]RQW00475.1 MAG: SCO family protein [candidate division KSB1 bacterium]
MIGLIFFNISAAFSQVADYAPDELKKIDVVEKLGEKIPLDLTFTKENGQEFTLDSFFHQNKPVIIVLAYYNCPMLCSLVLNGLTEAARGIDFKPAEDYTILTISIAPDETAELAAAKKKNYIQALGMPGADAGWFFCVGDSSQSRALADALGFKYFWDEERQEWAHPAVLHFLSKEGKITRYLYGLQYKPQDFRLGLLEASQGKIGTTIDRIVLYCFHYDANSEGYVVLAGNVMKLGGLVTVVILGIFLGILWLRHRVKTPALSSNKEAD